MSDRIFNRTHLGKQRKELRNNATPAEAMLWKALQRKQLAGRKFRRQHGIGNYIVDFYCPDEQLIIELDGAGHFTVLGQEADRERDAYFKALGLQVIRFENYLVAQDMEGVLAAIRSKFRR